MRYVSPLRFEIVILRYAINAIIATALDTISSGNTQTIEISEIMLYTVQLRLVVGRKELLIILTRLKMTG